MQIVVILHKNNETAKNMVNLKSEIKEEDVYYLLPAMSISLIATPMLGSINNVVKPLIRKEAESDRRPKCDRRTPTPACSRI